MEGGENGIRNKRHMKFVHLIVLNSSIKINNYKILFFGKFHSRLPLRFFIIFELDKSNIQDIFSLQRIDAYVA